MGTGAANRISFSTKRKPVETSSNWVTRAYLNSADGPVILTPTEALDLAAWVELQCDPLRSLMDHHGAVLLRFGVGTIDNFHRFVQTLSPEMLEYKERSSPRHSVEANIYTSTDYPAHQRIFFHNENSYQQTWPAKIFFYCQTPAAEGGETPISDVRKVYGALSRSLVERFEAKGCMYVRNFDEALGLNWQQVFQTDDCRAVERHCEDNDIICEWKNNNGLRTRAIRPAAAIHPRTGETVWFNHVAFFHISTLDESIREGLLGAMPEADLPANSYYGDGTPIEPDVIEEIRAAYEREAIAFTWQKGDVLALDNMLMAHSRNAFAGERKVLVAMAEPPSR